MTTHPRTISNPASPATAYNAADVTTPDNELLAHLNNLLDGTDDYVRLIGQTQSLTISTGSITATKNFVIVDTEAAAAADDLANILGYGEGRVLYIRMANAARVVTLKNLAGGSGEIDTWAAGDITLSASRWLKLVGTSSGWSDASTGAGSVDLDRCDGRLTLQAGTPIPNTDTAAATTLRFVRYRGNRITLYSGSKWIEYTFTDLSISVPASTNTNYDVFVYLSSGTPTLELVAWTNDTTRATALATQDGVFVKTGELTKRYVGTIRTTGVSGQCEDSRTKRFVWNYYHRIRRIFEKKETTDSWTYATATWRSLNNSTGNRVEFVIGWPEEPIEASMIATSSASANQEQAVGIGLDSTSTPSGLIGDSNATTRSTLAASYLDYSAVGYHYLQALEYAGGATVTFYGDNGGTYIQTGLHGTLWG